jgi:hypothetical protein
MVYIQITVGVRLLDFGKRTFFSHWEHLNVNWNKKVDLREIASGAGKSMAVALEFCLVPQNV